MIESRPIPKSARRAYALLTAAYEAECGALAGDVLSDAGLPLGAWRFDYLTGVFSRDVPDAPDAPVAPVVPDTPDSSPSS